MIDVATLTSMVNQTYSGIKGSARASGGFIEGERRSGGIGDPSKDFYNEQKLWDLAELNPGMTFWSNRLNRLVSGWEIRQSALWAAHRYPSQEDLSRQIRLRSEVEANQLVAIEAMVRRAEARERSRNRLGATAHDIAAMSSLRRGEPSLVLRATHEAANFLSGRDRKTFKVRELLTKR